MATEEEHREECIGLYEITSADSDGAGDSLRPLFTEVPRERGVLGSPYPASCIKDARIGAEDGLSPPEHRCLITTTCSAG